MTYPVFTEKESTHIRMSDETDTEIVEDLTFIELSTLPYVSDTKELRIVEHISTCLEHDILSGCAVFNMIYDSESLFTPVHTGHATKEIESFFSILQRSIMKIVFVYFNNLCHISPPCRSYGLHHRRISEPSPCSEAVSFRRGTPPV